MRLRTDDLVARLAADAGPVRGLGAGLGVLLAPALLASLALLGLGWGLRPDLGAALLGPPAVKVALPALVALLAAAGALRLGRAEEWSGTRRPLVLAAGAATALLALGLLSTSPEGWVEAARGRTLLACLLSIPALAALPTAALLLGLRRGASLRPRLSGALAGLAGGGAAAALYALHCTEDHPLFFVTWYGVGMLAVTAAGAAVGGRALRW